MFLCHFSWPTHVSIFYASIDRSGNRNKLRRNFFLALSIVPKNEFCACLQLLHKTDQDILATVHIATHFGWVIRLNIRPIAHVRRRRKPSRRKLVPDVYGQRIELNINNHAQTKNQKDAHIYAHTKVYDHMQRRTESWKQISKCHGKADKKSGASSEWLCERKML